MTLRVGKIVKIPVIAMNVNNIKLQGRGLHISHLNLRSMLNKHELIKVQLGDMGLDLITFSESWLTKGIEDSMIHINGYNIVRNDRTWTDGKRGGPKKGGGIGAYIRNSLSYTTAGLSQLNKSQKCIESLWFEINREKAKNIVMCIIYRPPTGDVSTFCDCLTEDINGIIELRNVELIVLGDFNINYNNKKDPDMKKLLHLQELTNLRQLIKENTRKDNCLDLILTNSDHISQSGVIELNISDHEMIYMTLKMKPTKHQKTSFLGRPYRNYDMNLFKTQLQNSDWEPFWDMRDPNACWDFIIKMIENVADTMCPLRERVVKEKGEIWLTNEILELIYDKDNAWKLAKKTNKQEDINYAKRLRNQTLSTIRRAKANFVQEELNGDISAKKFWEKINYVLPNSTKNMRFNLIDQTTHDPIPTEETAEYINDFFADIGPTLANAIPHNDIVTRPQTVPKACMPEMRVNEAEVLKEVNKIDVYKSSSVSQISSRLLKDAFLVIIPQLTYLYNLSFECNIFPSHWKIAKIIPLQKTGDTSDVNNLRPVSLLPLPGKLAERLAHNMISKYLEENNMYNPNQGGFRKK